MEIIPPYSYINYLDFEFLESTYVLQIDILNSDFE